MVAMTFAELPETLVIRDMGCSVLYTAMHAEHGAQSCRSCFLDDANIPNHVSGCSYRGKVLAWPCIVMVGAASHGRGAFSRCHSDVFLLNQEPCDGNNAAPELK